MPEEQNSPTHQSPDQFQPQAPDGAASHSDSVNQPTSTDDREPIVPRDEEGNLSYEPPIGPNLDKKEMTVSAIKAGAASEVRNIMVGSLTRYGEVSNRVSRAYQEGRAEGRLDSLPDNLGTASEYLEWKHLLRSAAKIVESQKYDIGIFEEAIQNNDKNQLRRFINHGLIEVSDEAPEALEGTKISDIYWCITEIDFSGSPSLEKAISSRISRVRVSKRGVPDELLAKATEMVNDGNAFYTKLEVLQILVQINKDYLIPALEDDIERGQSEIKEAERLLGLTEHESQEAA